MLYPVGAQEEGTSITLTKITTNGDTTTVFHFTLSRGGQEVGTADLTDGTSNFLDVVPDTYLLLEIVHVAS
jgi:hypothetical protein